MSKDEALLDFLTGFRLALKSASLYPKEHPAYQNSIRNLREKAEALLRLSPSVRIGFTPSALVIEEKTWEKEKFGEELAKLFHLRKIRSLNIEQGVTQEEWQAFVDALSLAPRDIYKPGGVRRIFEKGKMVHLAIQELDYSQLLMGEGEEVEDVWAYLLSDAVAKGDAQKIEQMSLNFPRIAEKINFTEIVENDEVREAYLRFFRYLREKEADHFRRCTKAMVKAIVKNKSVTKEEKLVSLGHLLKDANNEDLAAALWEELSEDSSFDATSLSFFSHLFGEERNQKIVSCLEEKGQQEHVPELWPRVKNRITSLLQESMAPFISPVYHQALLSLLRELSVKKEAVFDREELNKNYRFLLLNLLAGEKKRESLALIMDNINKEWDKIAGESDLEFLKGLSEVLGEKREVLTFDSAIKRFNTRFSDFVEKKILEEEDSPYLEFFLNRLSKSTLGVNYYFKTIFGESKVSATALRLFFHLFPDEMFYFNINLEKNKSDSRFLEKMVNCLAKVDSPLSLMTLKNIFALGNNAVKVQALQAMQHLSAFDEHFLFSLLRRGDWSIKKEAFIALKKEEGLKKKALAALFRFYSPFGLKNRLLLENLNIVADLNFKDATEFILPLSGRRFFWNRKLRTKAQELLRRWSVGTH